MTPTAHGDWRPAVLEALDVQVSYRGEVYRESWFMKYLKLRVGCTLVAIGLSAGIMVAVLIGTGVYFGLEKLGVPTGGAAVFGTIVPIALIVALAWWTRVHNRRATKGRRYVVLGYETNSDEVREGHYKLPRNALETADRWAHSGPGRSATITDFHTGRIVAISPDFVRISEPVHDESGDETDNPRVLYEWKA